MSSLTAAFVGGIIFNFANLLLVIAIEIAGMAIAFPIGIGIALVLGVFTNYIAQPEGDPLVLIIGVTLVALAILVDGIAYKRILQKTNENPLKGILFSASAGFPGSIEWMQYATDNTNVQMSTGTTSIMVNDIMPFVVSKQIQGILAGMPGAAEYESLVGEKGSATSGMDAQSIAHLVIVLFIVLGNTAYFIERKRSKKY